eukprot:gb/GECG01002342.1/.p1 GENE.gb/GECG01002342.1/~~gb/GECG01002342.1/.p1  ORF type:complete len:547 (+),score=70.10 gb/GECG01002342.1/:1-1641(+)
MLRRSTATLLTQNFREVLYAPHKPVRAVSNRNLLFTRCQNPCMSTMVAGVPVEELDEQLEHFPEWAQASQAIQQGNADKAVQDLQRIVEVLSRMGGLSPMALYARKKLINVCHASRNYSVGGHQLATLNSEISEEFSKNSSSLPLKEFMHIWLTASSLYLHIGDPRSAIRLGQHVIKAAGKPLVASNFKDLEPEQIHFVATAHNRILAGLASLAEGSQPHDNPYPHETAAIEAWTDLMENSTSMREKEFAEIGASIADRNLAAYNYSVGRVNEGDEACLTFGGHYVEEAAEASTSQTTASDYECIPKDTLAAYDLLDSSLYMLPGSAMIEGFGDDEFDQGIEEHMKNEEELSTDVILLRSDLESYMAKLLMKQNSYEKASDLLNRVLKEQEQHLPPDHPQFARTLSLLGVLYHGTDRAVTAEGLFRSAFEKWENSSGLNSQHSASPAGIHPHEASEWLEAVESYSKLLKQWEKREEEAKSFFEDKSGKIAGLIRRYNARQYSINPVAYYGSWKFGSLDSGSERGTSLSEDVQNSSYLHFDNLRTLY